MSDSTDGGEPGGGVPGGSEPAVDCDPETLRRKRAARVRRGIGLMIFGTAVLGVLAGFLVGYRVNPRDLALDAAPFWLIFAGLATSLVATVTGFALLVTRPRVDEIVSAYDARVREHASRAGRDDRQGDRQSAIRSLEAAIRLEREKLASLPRPEEVASRGGSGGTELVGVIQDARSNVERLRTRKADLERVRGTDGHREDGSEGRGSEADHGNGKDRDSELEDRKR